MRKIWLLTTLLVGGLLLTGCNKSVNVENEQERIFACWRSVSEYLGISDYSINWDKEEEAWASFVLNWRVNIWNGIDEEKITKNVQCVVDMVNKSVTILEIDEPEISLIDQLKQSFTWNLINWKVDESLLTNKPNNIYFDITWDSTLYYIDEFWLAFTLWEEWKWWKIENAYEWKYLASVRIRNEWLKTYWIFIIDNTTYQRIKDSLSNDEDETIWYNNQYTFQRRIVDNWDKLWEYNLVLYEVDNEKYNLYNQFLEDIKSSWEQPQGKKYLNIPSFEELEDVVAMCPYEVMWWWYSEYPVYKREFIIPYKDWYIWYNYWWNWWWWGYYLTYKSLDKPCEIISYTDEFFYRHVHYKHDLEEYNEYEYPDNKVYLSQWWMSWIPVDIVEKELNCESWKDMNEDNICKKEVDQFMYNLILWKEENETFTEWMDILKKSIDNTDYYTWSIWFNRWENCNKEFSWESLMKEYWEDTKNLSEEKRREYQKLQNKRIHNCLENLNK